MADAVHYELEKMIPELEDLQERGIFTQLEIKQIVKKRTDLEYKIHRKIPLKKDFLMYIQYEINLEKLRKKRKDRYQLNKPNHKELGEKAITLSDYSIVRRIHAIYLKTLKKFSNDIRIWVQYFDWSIKAKSCRTLGKNFARAIQLHPTKSIFWIMAASYEFEQNHNITSARILLQRAIRINPQDQKLWLEYFKLELLWIFKLKERRRVLFQEKKVDSVPVNSSDEQEGVELPKLSNENEDDDVFEKDSILAQSRAENTTELMNEKLSATQQALVQLSIPRAVYRNAIIYIPNDVDFRLSFLDIYHTFDLDSIAAQTDIFDSLKQDFPAEPKVIKIICERHIVKYKSDDPEYPIALGKTVQEYIEHLNEARNSTLWVYFVEFLTLQQTKCDEPNLLKYLSMNLQYAFEQSDTNGLATISIYLSWYKQSKDIKIIEKGLTYHPNSSLLWIERIEFETTIENRIELFKQAIEVVNKMEQIALWRFFIDYLIDQSYNPSEIDSLFKVGVTI
ncbi:U3 small nucleolar RNA-associated protein 6-domain-containing protein [Globomyces pollinis-pini]|nr:U3 small nucleolar RNA-associated protein 6-domain-containing protein [Globomyces pollinis-pini]